MDGDFSRPSREKSREKTAAMPKGWRRVITRRIAQVAIGLAALEAVKKTAEYFNDRKFEPWELFEPKESFPGLGAARRELSQNPEALKAREEAIIEDQKFVVLRDPFYRKGVEAVVGDNNLRQTIESAASANGIPADILSAIIWVESNADPKAQSKTGPLGIMQFAKGTAKDMGLISSRSIYRDVIKFFRRGRKRIEKKQRVEETVVVDGRLDPAKAIPAGAKHLSQLRDMFGGQLGLAIFAYHTGQGGASEVIRAAAKSLELDSIERVADDRLKDLSGNLRARNISRNKILEDKEGDVERSNAKIDSEHIGDLVKKYEFTAAKLYFDCSPKHHVLQYRAVQKYMDRDWGPTYFFRIKAAERLIQMYRNDRAQFDATWRSMRYQRLLEDHEPDRVVPHRMDAWYGKKDVRFGTRAALETAEKGTAAQPAWLHPVPKDHVEGFFGYHLRTRPDEGGRIAEKDMEHQKSYLYLGKPAAGCLFYLANEYRKMFGFGGHPIEVTTLVRHVGYQGALAAGEKYEEEEDENGPNMLDTEESVSKVAQETLNNSRHRSGGNPQAEQGQKLPLHCTGLAFDVPYWGSNEKNLLFILDDMRSAGLLDFIKEKLPPNFHIMPSKNPKAVKIFERAYDEGMKGYKIYKTRIESAMKAGPRGSRRK